MFEKMLYSGTVLYFRYAPPLTHLDEVSEDKLPNMPYNSAKAHERSVYYYWWLFLKENVEYIATCENDGQGSKSSLYEDFGDLRGDCFMDWWKGGGRLLFCEPPEEEITRYLSLPTKPIERDRVLLSVPVTGDLDRTMSELRKMLKPAFDHVRKKRLHRRDTTNSYSRARYPVFTKPVLTALHDRLMVFRARNERPSASLYELGEITGIVSRTTGDKHDADHRNRVRALVGRALNEAKALVHNVGEGRFPDTTPPRKN